MTEPERHELQELCDRLLEGQLSAEQQQRLEELVVTRPEARRFYVEYTHQHGCLHWNAGEPGFVMPAPAPAPAPAPVVAKSPRWLRAAALLAAAVVLVLGTWLVVRPSQAAVPALATLVGSKTCKWDASTLPTEEGARLPQGRLRLAEGIARITFDSGAEITLEAPADLELISAKRCVLHGGRLVAKVPPQAIGFIVDTPTAVMTDLGTEFGVNVKDAQTAELQVFNGLVDAQHRKTGKTDRLPTGRNRRYGVAEAADFDPAAEKPTAAGGAPAQAGARVVHISTALGRGKDAFVQPLFPSTNHSEILLLVKHTINEKSDYNRKAYIGLDLASLAGQTILDAQLSLTFTPTGMGFASEVPDATFAVYGLIDETLDDWDERTMRWKNAPANRPGGVDLDADKVVKLGTFTIPPGALQGTRGISGPALTKFLAADTNGMATFIVVRETIGSGRSDLVHGFASKNHPYLAPPTLKVTVAPK